MKSYQEECKAPQNEEMIVQSQAMKQGEVDPGEVEQEEVDDASEPSSVKALFQASEDGDVDAVQRAIKSRVDINARNDLGCTPLMRAIAFGNLDIVRLLLGQNGIKFNALDEYADSPLMFAANIGSDQAVSLLLDKEGIEIDRANKFGNTALMDAAMNGHYSVVTCLLERGADINFKTSYGFNALMLSCQIGSNDHVKVVRILLSRPDVRVNDSSNFGETPLMLACLCGCQEMVQILLGHGAEINACSVFGSTPLMCAAFYGHTHLVEYLLERGADPSILRKDGKSSADVARETLFFELGEKLDKVIQNHSALPSSS